MRPAARILGLAIAVEALTIILLVVIVMAFGPSEAAEAEAFAQRHGQWVGPVGGFAFTLGGAWVASRRLTERHVATGLLLGATVATVDIILLLESSADFEVVFVVSNLGRLVAGALGGWLASRRSATLLDEE